MTSASGSTGNTPTTGAEAAVKGGTLVIGAEQEPDCADWIATCAGASLGHLHHGRAHHAPVVRLRLPEVRVRAEHPPRRRARARRRVPRRRSPTRSTRRPSGPTARPITSADYKYTWDQIATGNDIYDKTGYDKIESVDSSDPTTAVVTFAEPFAGWKDLFGGFYGIYPEHLLDGKDRNAEMKDGYKWSGGPWMHRVLDQGSGGQARSEHEVLGQAGQPRCRRVQVPPGHVGRDPGLQDRPGFDDLPAGPARARRAQDAAGHVVRRRSPA